MIRIAVLFIVDRRGWLLMQERDDAAPLYPDQWGAPGGHVEEGEDFETAARREAAEETGLRLAPGELTLWHDEVRTLSHSADPVHYQCFTATTDAGDDDIVLGEGRQMVFVPPDRVPGLDLHESARHFVPLFLASPAGAALLEQ